MAEDITQLLETHARDCIKHSRGVSIDDGRIAAAPIYKWYAMILVARANSNYIGRPLRPRKKLRNRGGPDWRLHRRFVNQCRVNPITWL